MKIERKTKIERDEDRKQGRNIERDKYRKKER